jgi:hypothetical protein
LADSTFWFLDNLIKLTLQDPVSDFINVDTLPHEQKTIINKSAKCGDIKIFDPEKRRLKSTDDADYISGEFAVDINDIEDDETDTVPEVFSVTVNEEVVEEDFSPTETDFENARLLLIKNGNTVRKAIKKIPVTRNGLLLLHACLEVEGQNKERVGIIDLIKQKLAKV